MGLSCALRTGRDFAEHEYEQKRRLLARNKKGQFVS